MKYRIVKIEKKGYYKYYAVEQRLLFVFWTRIGGSFDTFIQAQKWLEDYKVRETKVVVSDGERL